jgi:hypothetical protein
VHGISELTGVTTARSVASLIWDAVTLPVVAGRTGSDSGRCLDQMAGNSGVELKRAERPGD